MKIEFTKKISEIDKNLIKNIVNTSCSIVQNFFDINSIRINVDIDEPQTIPEWGVGGIGDHSSIDIFLEENRQSDWEKHLPRTIFHECHHFIRGNQTDLDKTLVDLVFSEGLALHFEVEADGAPPSFFSKILTESQRDKMYHTFKVEYKDSSYDHARWFFGNGEFSFQAGYDLSYFLVGKFLKDRKTTASKSIGINSDEFVRYLNL